MDPFNPLDPRLTVDPYPLYADLRQREPVHLSALGAYVLTRYEDVQKMLSDDEAFQHQYVAQQKQRTGDAVEEEPYFDYFRRMIFVLDHPDHRRLRKLITQAFTPKRVRELRQIAETIASELLDQAATAGGMDFVTEFAFPFPLRVIGSILGIPDSDHARIGEYATALNPVLEFLPMSDDVLATANNAVQELATYFTSLAEKRRKAPTDDLFSALVHASEDGDSLSNKELIANAILLYVAGHETTAGGSALALLSLHRNPDQLSLLKQNPDLIPGAIEELLRYDTPGQGTARVVMKPVTFRNQTIEPGNIVLGYLGAANRDPEAYTDPDRLDIQRDLRGRRPLTWGGGAHLCLGRNLALQELEVALNCLLSRHPDARVRVDEPQFRETPLMRGLRSLPIEW